MTTILHFLIHLPGRLAAALMSCADRVRYCLADENGATTIEYVLISAFVSLALVSGYTTLGQALSRSVSQTARHLS